jgi:hypothetical protein
MSCFPPLYLLLKSSVVMLGQRRIPSPIHRAPSAPMAFPLGYKIAVPCPDSFLGEKLNKHHAYPVDPAWSCSDSSASPHLYTWLQSNQFHYLRIAVHIHECQSCLLACHAAHLTLTAQIQNCHVGTALHSRANMLGPINSNIYMNPSQTIIKQAWTEPTTLASLWTTTT